jgi:imidazole glycerol-phosphate synthase subunit HisH
VRGALVLIDYGAGNLRSVENALKAAGAGHVLVTDKAEDVLAAERVVLPGVGAFAHCKAALMALPGMVEALEDVAITKARPFLGICVGMQLMAQRGLEHGETAGLGWLGGEVVALAPDNDRKIPHMGWNDVVVQSPHSLLQTGEAYFLHSYAYQGEGILATTDYEGEIVAAIGRDNLLGVQFHPEKSQRYGLAFLQRFLEWKP